MKFRKKLLTVFLFVVCALSLVFAVGCGGGLGGTKRNTVTVTYYLYDGGSSYQQSIYEGEILNITPLSRKGYQFAGMYSEPEGSGIMYVNAQGIGQVNIHASVTLWAHWTKAFYTFAYEANEGAEKPAADFRVEFGGEMPKSGYPAAEREGYDFVGWFAGNVQLTDGTELKSGISTLTEDLVQSASSNRIVLKPVFEEKHVTVTFDYNGYEIGGQDLVERKLSYNNQGIASVAPQVSSISGADFVGWSVYADRYEAFTESVQKDMTLYAIWKKYTMVSVCLNEETGSIESVKVYDGDGNYIPERNGYRFENWYTSSSFGGNSRVTLNYYTANPDTIYYARFDIATYTITFVSNCSANVNSLTYTIEDHVTLPAGLTKEHFTFVGWCEEEDLSGQILTDVYPGSYGDKVLYAKFRGDAIGVTLSVDGKTSRVNVEYGAHYLLNPPEKEDYAFVGWFDAESGGKQFTEGDGKSLAVWNVLDDDTVLYAQWSRKCYLTVSVDVDGGEDSAEVVRFSPELKPFYAVGERVSFTVTLNDSGYKFVKIKNNTANTELNNATYSFIMPTSGYDLTVFVEAKVYNVTLDRAGGVCSAGTAQIKYRSAFTLPVAMKDKNTFKGWAYNGKLVTDAKGVSVGVWEFTDAEKLVAVFEASDQRVIEISDAASLMQIYSSPSATFYLTQSVAFPNDNAARVKASAGVTFSGILEGNGHTISNVGGDCGLFDIVSGTVCNLTLNVNVVNTQTGESLMRRGGLTSTLKSGGVVYNVTVKGVVRSEAPTDVGGLVGYAEDKTSVYRCTNDASVTGGFGKNGCAGGIVGSASAMTRFENNMNRAKISGVCNAGGLIGWQGANFTLKDCINLGNVSASSDNAGGMIGSVQSGKTPIDGCKSSGTVTGGKNIGKYVGTGSYTLNNAVVDVKTAEDLRNIKNFIAGERYVLLNDINAGVWTAFDFGATLDGNDHAITFSGTDGLFFTLRGTVCNLTLNATVHNTEKTGKPYLLGGVAASLNGATVYNVTVNGSIKSDTPTDLGGIAGNTTGNESSVYNCRNHATLTSVYTSYGSAGGIIGSNGKNTRLENNANTGNVTIDLKAGGIIGYNGVSSQKILNCTNSGTITATKEMAGGVVGHANSAVVVEGCNSTGEVVSPKNIGKYVGYGSATYVNMSNVIAVSSVADLAKLKLHIAPEIYRLTADIYLQSEWTAFDFGATLDGNGHKISGLVNDTGLFNVLSGTVCNLTLDSVALQANVGTTSYYAMGAVAARVKGAVIYKVRVTGRVDGRVGTAGAEVGGLVGTTERGSAATSIYDCVNEAEVYGNYNHSNGAAGGIIGVSYIASGKFENNVNRGDVYGRAKVGGVLGYVDANYTVKNCENYGGVTATADSVGGILGRANSGTTTFDGCKVGEFQPVGTASVGKYIGYGKYSYLNMNYVYDVASQADLDKAYRAVETETYRVTKDFTLDHFWTAFDFVGTLDGNGHTVTIEDTPYGLFATLYGTVHDLEIVANVTATNSANARACLGAVAGILNGATVHDVKVSGSIRGNNGYHVGGIAGYAESKTWSVYNCENNATITGEYYEGSNRYGAAGGLVGAITYTPARFEGNVNRGNVSGGRNVGGIVGYLNVTATFVNCYNSGEVKALKALKVSNSGACDFAGGFVGYISSGTFTLSACYAVENCAVSEGGNAGQYSGRGTPQMIDSNLETEISNATLFLKMKGSVIPEKVYKLTNDITLTDWTAFDFCGTLDGNGHKITIKGSSGLFDTLTGTVRDLTLAVELNVVNGTAGGAVGALANVLNGGKLANVTLTGRLTVSGEAAHVGGFAGVVLGNAKLTSCTNQANVTNSTKAFEEEYGATGGMIGLLLGTSNSLEPLKNLTNAGAVSGTVRVGGIVGYCAENCIVTACVNDGNVTAKDDYAGGLVGATGGTVELKNCTAGSGTVTAEKNSDPWVGNGAYTVFQTGPSVL